MKTTAKKEAIYQRIKKHGDQLNVFFNTGIEPVELCKKLRRLENKAHSIAEQLCNGEIEQAEYDLLSYKILQKVKMILRIENAEPCSPDDSWPVIFNGDPRGYALKIHDSYVSERCLDIYRDMGGYGIIAPDLS